MTETIIEIELDKIKPNPYQPRKSFNETEINSLADSIKQQGLLSPIVVRRVNDYYEIACGERRFRAVKVNQSKTILAIVRQLTNEQMAEIGLTENLQREDINPIEEAQGYVKLQEEFNYTQEKVSQVVGKSRVHITNTLRLLKLDNLALTYIKCGILTPAHGQALLQLEQENKSIEHNLADLTWDLGISVNELRQIVRDINESYDPHITRNLPITSISQESVKMVTEIFTPDKEKIEQLKQYLTNSHQLPEIETDWKGWDLKTGKLTVDFVYGVDEYYTYKDLNLEEIPIKIFFTYFKSLIEDRKNGVIYPIVELNFKEKTE